MEKIERKECAFENDFVKIMKPTREQEMEIASMLREYSNKKDNGRAGSSGEP